MSAASGVEKLDVFLFDVDGVLTDAGLFVSDDGRMSKRFDIRDGAILKLLQRAGYFVGWISGHKSLSTDARARDLGVDLCMIGVKDKGRAIEDLVRERRWTTDRIFYMGDDWIDMPAMQMVGYAATVPHAPAEVKRLCRYVTSAQGGYGAVREVIEKILREQGKLDGLIKEAQTA